jgi:hypothetical protein
MDSPRHTNPRCGTAGVPGFEEAQVVVLSHERRWPSYPALAARCEHLPQLWELRLEGMPLVTAYRLQTDDIDAQPAQ